MSPGAEPQRNILDQEEQEARSGRVLGVGAVGKPAGPPRGPSSLENRESECFLRGKTEENSNPALENWDLGKLNPLCKREQGGG